MILVSSTYRKSQFILIELSKRFYKVTGYNLYISFFSSSDHLNCPFEALSLSSDTKYSIVKSRFLSLALQYHPDILHPLIDKQVYLSSYEKKKRIDEANNCYVSLRKAFESIQALPCGGSLAYNKYTKSYKSSKINDFDKWFHDNTGYRNPYNISLDAKTQLEVSELDDTLGLGQLNRDGGMWTLAQMVSASVKKDGLRELLSLQTGEISKNKQYNRFGGTLRRRREGGGRNNTVW